ncbi:MAG: hypothetical protein ACO3A2_11715 [Bdellovibrionia bacterium]
MSVLFFLLSLRALIRLLVPQLDLFSIQRAKRELLEVSSVLREIEETLAAGLVPAGERWERIRRLSEPWGKLLSTSFDELRSSGGSLLPTLKRMRDLAESQRCTLLEAQARSAQAWAQALFCSSLVPFLGLGFYLLLPALQAHPWDWGLGCFWAGVMNGCAALWLLKMGESARWAGIPAGRRGWVLGFQCAGERLLALIRMGTPTDLAWVKACEFLGEQEAELSRAWGPSIWSEAAQSSPSSWALGSLFQKPVTVSSAERIMLEAGHSMKFAIRLGVMEGRPCLDRIEAALLGARQELKARVDEEIELTSSRALKPLFLLVAPALLGLIGLALWLALEEVGFEL